jgi:hypothetical protein
MTLAAGTKLGAYEILSTLGAGGMGEVYRARDPRLGRDVAVKVLPAAFSSDPDRLRRFEQEARAAGQLNHPNVLTVYEFGVHKGAPFIVSELVEGEPRRQCLREGAIPLRKAIEYHSDRPWFGCGARKEHLPSRPQAGKPIHHHGRAGEDSRLRPRQADPAGGALGAGH